MKRKKKDKKNNKSILLKFKPQSTLSNDEIKLYKNFKQWVDLSANSNVLIC